MLLGEGSYWPHMISGHALHMNGDLVKWSTHKQRVFGASLTEVGYINAQDACNDDLLICQCRSELVQVYPLVRIRVKNQPSTTTTNINYLMHIDLQRHKSRQRQQSSYKCGSYRRREHCIGDMTKTLDTF